MTLSRRQILRMASGLAAATVASSLTTFRSLAENASAPSFLTGHFRPVEAETTAFDIPVRGAIPTALAGRYFRNGQNPQGGENPGAWFYGAGMIHGLRIADGRAEWHRNRYVRTPALDGAPLFREDGSMDLTASAAATSVISHASRILALQEVNLPFEITPELETIGAYDFGGALIRASTPEGWHVADRSGSGNFNRNIVAMVTPPDRESYFIAIFLSDADADFNTRNGAVIELYEAVMQVVTSK